MDNSTPTEGISVRIVVRFRVHDIQHLGSVITACERRSVLLQAM
jgi:hypothetical protein